MIKAKLVLLISMGILTVGGSMYFLNVESNWGRYTFQSTIGTGTSVTVNYPHDGEPIHVEAKEPVSTNKTLDLGSLATLTTMYGMAVLTGYALRGRRKTFVKE